MYYLNRSKNIINCTHNITFVPILMLFVLYIFISFRYNKMGGVMMKYSIEIGKIIEGALKHDQTKVINYTKQLVSKLEKDNDSRSATLCN